MTTATYQQLALAWHPQSKSEKPFIIFAVCFVLLFVGLGLYIGSVELPKETKRAKVVIPERVAKFILEKPKPKPKPKVIKKEPAKPKVIKKDPPKPKDKPKIKKKQVKKQQVLTKKQVKAREVASESGLLALSNELSDLMDTSSIDAMVGNRLAKNNIASSQKISAQRDTLLTADAGKGSGGVSTANVLNGSRSSVKLDGAQVAAAQQQLLAARADTSLVEGVEPEESVDKSFKRTGNYRPEEDIAYVMDKNKSKLHALYRKARRSNPGIKGKIVLEITISPEGKVLVVNIASSELNDKRLESRIVARVRQFNFGAADVKSVTVTYPVEFLPS
ncbi:AgmX/PglI C-terminal domain-containing protein [Colwellia psychrerythraea]|uniref:TonB family protein n=1 Tax=Colwellia psychrerythraea TaxID=28229 RepID=A0A099KX87_COLPS|nr:AgmX/PglI C-terminal domain-containing protein [Colwellia psychrerythraea]KGJ94800.1 TonB family protein [Colwellia psychrerythraea]